MTKNSRSTSRESILLFSSKIKNPVIFLIPGLENLLFKMILPFSILYSDSLRSIPSICNSTLSGLKLGSVLPTSTAGFAIEFV